MNHYSRTLMLRAPEDSGATGAAQPPPTTPAQPSALDQVVGAIGELTANIAKLTALQAQPAQVQSAATTPTTTPALAQPAAADRAPVGPVDVVTEAGILNAFALSEHDIRTRLGPSGVRKWLDQCRQLDHAQSGLARLPSVPNPYADSARRGHDKQNR